MQMLSAIRTVANETGKLMVALSAILIPLFFVAVVVEHIRGTELSPTVAVVSLLKGVWY